MDPIIIVSYARNLLTIEATMFVLLYAMCAEDQTVSLKLKLNVQNVTEPANLVDVLQSIKV